MATPSSSPSSRPPPEVLEDAPELEFWRSDSWVDIWSGLPLQMPPEGTAAGLVRSALLPGSNVNFPQITEICERIAAEPPEGQQAVQLLVAAMRDGNAPFRKKLKALTISNELMYDDRAVACFRSFTGFQQALVALRAVQNTGLSAYVDENIRMLASEVDKVCFGGSAPPREGRLQGFGSAFRNNLEAAAGALRRPADQATASSAAPAQPVFVPAASKPVPSSMPSTAPPQVAPPTSTHAASNPISSCPGSMQGQSVLPPSSSSPFASEPGASNSAGTAVSSSALVPNGRNAVPNSPFQVQGSSGPGFVGGATAVPSSQPPAQEAVRSPPVLNAPSAAPSMPAPGGIDLVGLSGPPAQVSAVSGMTAAAVDVGRQAPFGQLDAPGSVAMPETSSVAGAVPFAQPTVAASFARPEASSVAGAVTFGQPSVAASFATPEASSAAGPPSGQPSVAASFAMPEASNAAVASAFDITAMNSAPPQSGGGASSFFD
eukprot:TRINITY_DN44176_c0_g1_i1.p1 TRINITY_DN44176_c0_g1~~TRINITY_DN44176_c0_g1_i1.p1  ORF type:complete len:490 (-),score=83.25 TRINITY_DN44176_c0_g1_i1:55-1524(-)